MSTSITTSSESFHQRIKKFSKFLTTKVKEKTHHAFVNDNNIIHGGGGIVRRHSSYTQPNSSLIDEMNDFSYDDTMIDSNSNTSFKQEDLYHFNIMPSPITTVISAQPSQPITAALSPPPRQLKKKEYNKSNPTFNTATTNITKPCLSRSNTLGHHHSSSSNISIVKHTTVGAPTASTNHTGMNNNAVPISLINNHSSSFGSSSISQFTPTL